MIEVLVSALIVVVASAGVATVLATSASTSNEQRHGSEAYALAQEDQARLQTMQLAKLNHLYEKREVPLNGTTFSVISRGLFVNNKTSTQACTEGSTADYAQITSEVTWPGMVNSEKAKIESILSPTTSALDPSHGTLMVSVSNENLAPIPGVKLSGIESGGTGAFSGETDANGCAVFPDLPTETSTGAAAPNYTITVNGEYAGVINKEAKATETTTGAASTENPKILSLRFDHPGTIPINFKYRVGSSSEFKPAKADSLFVFNTGMTQAKTFWTSTGLRESTVNATPLFPFLSSYTIYPGSCTAANPNPKAESNPPTAAAIANVIAPSGASATPTTVQLPALNLTVNNAGKAFKGARVTVTDKTCKEAKETSLIKREFTTNEKGQMSATASGEAEPGLPWGKYELCVSGEVKAGEFRRVVVSSVAVENLTTGTTQTVELATGESGKTCP